MSALFGPAAVGLYSMAYNLADVPAARVGEQLAGVLLPAMKQLGPEQQKAAATRGTAAEVHDLLTRVRRALRPMPEPLAGPELRQ